MKRRGSGYRINKTKIFRRMLIPVLGLIFLTIFFCMVILISSVSNNLRKEERRLLTDKMYTIAEDLNNQLDDMRNIVRQIAADERFRLERIQSDKYYEIEAAEQLQKFRDYHSIFDEYFVKYKAHAKIFTSAGTTISPENYFSMGVEDEDCLLELLDELCLEKKNRLFLYKENDTILFLFPVQVYCPDISKQQMVVGFCVTEKAVAERIKEIVGNVSGDICIVYDDFIIIGDEDIQNSCDLAYGRSGTGFQIYIRMDENYSIAWNKIFSKFEILTLCGIVILMVILVVLVSWWNYSPFHKIMNKYHAVLSHRELQDWDDLDNLIESLLHDRHINQSALNEQYRNLREQAVRLLFSEGYSDSAQKYLALLNIDLGFAAFCMVRVRFSEGSRLEDCRKELYYNIEELSGKQRAFYIYWDDERTLHVLVATQEEYELLESREILEALLDVMELDAEMEMSGTIHDLREINFLHQEKQDNCADSPEAEKEEPKEAVVEQTSAIKHALEYIRTHFSDYDLSLEAVAKEIQLTPQHLSAKFKMEIGIGYKEYLTNLRIEEAQKLLEESELGVGDICQRIGLINVSYFIKIFQKVTGLTPTRYRVEYRERLKQISEEKSVEGENNGDLV